MAEGTPEAAISPMGPGSQPKEGKPGFFKRLFSRTPRPVAAPDITPAVSTNDFIPTAAPVPESAPLNTGGSDLSIGTSIDAQSVQADLTAQMAAHVNAIPGTAKAPGMIAPDLPTLTPTPPPTERVDFVSVGADPVASTKTQTETPEATPVPADLTEKSAA